MTKAFVDQAEFSQIPPVIVVHYSKFLRSRRLWRRLRSADFDIKRNLPKGLFSSGAGLDWYKSYKVNYLCWKVHIDKRLSIVGRKHPGKILTGFKCCVSPCGLTTRTQIWKRKGAHLKERNWQSSSNLPAYFAVGETQNQFSVAIWNFQLDLGGSQKQSIKDVLPVHV